MAQLAIKGHPTRGKEVIQLLETLGGENSCNLKGVETDSFYYICKDNDIYLCLSTNTENFIVFTLEEFEEKFPYKVGNKVQHKGTTSCGSVYVIEQMKWEDNQVKYVICDLYWKNCKCTVISKDLQPYKEETNMKTDCPNNKPKLYAVGLKDGEVIECEVNMKDNKATGSRIDFSLTERIELELGDTHEVVVENGKTYVVKKKPQYPKDYDECCEVLGCKADDFYTDFSYKNRDVEISDYEDKIDDLLQNFRKLRYCRDVYWKIAGEQLGLDKPWEYDTSKDEFIYAIVYQYGYIQKCEVRYKNHILAFPTAEMRDVFYENFKDLINECKELL